MINEIINMTQGKKLFTVLDLSDGFFQIKINPEDKHKTAFYFRNNLYQYTMMPQGYKNSPAVFQMIMDHILSDIMETKYMVYMDDIIVYGKDETEHDRNLCEVLTRLSENNFKVNPEKMQ
ncbi:Retrovirus-related Pol polyprotein from transposon opus [Nosema granulosis]|uniref:Retrovirus-related Pol polyprotein from transposon opus n=1 Tax=Nosema granulosis TaxID=83296 RepID=A0A9P6KYK9_9MICR|nr:Retrovirus-related Pol polyprotein from transposon opus [Nosema granulosis]